MKKSDNVWPNQTKVYCTGVNSFTSILNSGLQKLLAPVAVEQDFDSSAKTHQIKIKKKQRIEVSIFFIVSTIK